MDLDWNSLGFAYMDTKCHLRYTWKDGAWHDGVLCDEPYLRLHIAATALHYGQAVFEGLKAFACADGKVRIFRASDNAQRMIDSGRRLCMATPSVEMFVEGVHRVVAANREYVPPYGTNGALYVRPLLFGSGPRIGVNPADEYTFLLLTVPVGDYYKGGLNPVGAVVFDDYDRAAPLGVGHVKVAGNYAADMEPSHVAKSRGFPIILYLDAREHRYVEEFGTSNFIAVTRDNTYVTPESHSILPSITNKTLMTLAADLGMAVERRPVEFGEVETFAEVAACGTAVVITPVNRLVRGDREIRIGPATGVGPVLGKLYKQVRGIQVGELPDPHGWNVELNA